NLVVIIKISLDADSELAKIVHILRHFSAFLNPRVNRVGDSGEDRDDRYYDEQFDQRETAETILCHYFLQLRGHDIGFDARAKAKKELQKASLLDKPSASLCM